MSTIYYPKLAVICPTYGRPSLARRILSCFLTQHYPPDRCHLLIVDDADQILHQRGANWSVVSLPDKFDNICDKYRFAISLAITEYNPHGVVFMDDDDHYLPGYLAFHGTVLGRLEHAWSKDSFILSDYQQKPGELMTEPSDGRFHGSVGFTAETYAAIGGYPVTKRPTFDQEFLAALSKHAPRGTVHGFPQYVYRWTYSGFPHATSQMTKQNGEDWYAKIPITEPITIRELTPAYDELARRYTLAYSGREPVGELVGRA